MIAPVNAINETITVKEETPGLAALTSGHDMADEVAIAGNDIEHGSVVHALGGD